MKTTNIVALALGIGGVACLGLVAWINKTSGPIISDPSKLPIILLFLGIALLYAGIRWFAFGGLLQKIAS